MKTQVIPYRVDTMGEAAQVMRFWLHAVSSPIDDVDLALCKAHLRRIATQIIAGIE